MSSRKKKTGTDVVVLKVLRSSGMSDEFSMNLKQSLKDLKEAIQKSSKLGSLSTDCQRIFHLGRELKTAGRSLEKLGVGNHGIFLLHLFPRPSKPKKTSSSSSRSSSSSSRGKRRLRSSKGQPDDDSNTSDKELVDLANASDEEDEEHNAVSEQVRDSARGRKRRRLTR